MSEPTYGPSGDPSTIAEREWFWSEINKWKKIAHDLYMASSHIENCRGCRERALVAMYEYEEAFNV